MPKEWILNQANMRWQLTYKRSVGPVAKWIRECSPKSLEDWKKGYGEKLMNEKSINADKHFEELGKRLCKEIKRVVSAEIDEISEKDCIDYIREVVIERTYEGYQAEMATIYGELEQKIGVKIEPAPDEWDRGYFVDYYIKINGSYIGLQVKSAPNDEKAPEWVERWGRITKDRHKEFEEKYGGKVFMVYSTEDNKEIYNKEVIDQIKSEISRLRTRVKK